MNTICSLLNKIRRRRTTNMENVTEQNQLLKVEREEKRKMKEERKTKEHMESNTKRIERLEQRFEACELGTKIQPESVVRSETLPQTIGCTNDDLPVQQCTHPEPDGLQRLPAAEPPNDAFADILIHLADDLYDDVMIYSLGRQLGIGQGEIERALQTNVKLNRVTSVGTRHMLLTWRRDVSRRTERSELRRALLAAKLVDLAEKYFPEQEIDGGAVVAVNEDNCPTSLLSNSNVNDGSSPGSLQSNRDVIEGRETLPQTIGCTNDELPVQQCTHPEPDGLQRLPAAEPPNDAFADILIHLAEDLYDDMMIYSLGRQLGIGRGEIERALQTNVKLNRVTSFGTHHMLLTWRRGVSRRNKWSELRRALLAAKLVNLADKYIPEQEIDGGAVLAVNEDNCPTSLLSNSNVNDGSSPGSLQSNHDVIEGRGAVTSESGRQRRGDATLESVIQRRDIKEIHEPDYEIGELISSGGFGKVHKGQWESKMVAVKRITVTEGGMAVIEKEIKFNGLVKHPNIVVLHAYCKYKPGTSSNICFDLIMDFIKGFTLHDALFVHKVRNLKISKGRLHTAQKISAALAHMHSKRCTHSDIKTDNILIREQDNEPFICDLGLAHGVTHSAVTDISSGRRQRAPVWYPPESLVTGVHPVASYKADVWAMGRVLLEIFTGRPVWEGLSQGSDEVPPDSIIIGHLMRCHYDENHDVTPHTIKYVEDKSVRDLIRRCFSAKPNERPSAKNLADQFGEVLNKKETSSSNRPTVSKDDYVDMK